MAGLDSDWETVSAPAPVATAENDSDWEQVTAPEAPAPAPKKAPPPPGEASDFSWSRAKNDLRKIAQSGEEMLNTPLIPDWWKDAGEGRNRLEQVTTAINKTGSKLLSSLSTPENLTLAAAMGPLSKLADEGSALAAKAVDLGKAYFASSATVSAGEAVPGAVATIKDPKASLQSKLEGVGDVAAPAALAGMIMSHGGETKPEPPGPGEASENTPEVVKAKADADWEPVKAEPAPEAKETATGSEPAGAPSAVNAGDDSAWEPVKAEAQPEQDLEGFETEPQAPVAENAPTQSPQETEPVKESEPAAPESEEAEPVSPLEQPPEAGGAELDSEPGGREFITGIKNAEIDKEMEIMGLAPGEHGPEVPWDEAAQDAQDKLAENKGAGGDLVSELAAKPRALDSKEGALLLTELTRLKNQRERAQVALDAAIDSGDPVQEADARTRNAVAQQNYANAATVADQVGTLNGQGLAIRKAMMAQDYTLAGVERRVVDANEGAALHPKDAAELEAVQKELAETRQRLEDANTALKQTKVPRVPRASPLRNRFSDAADAARARIKARLAEGRVQSGLDPADLADHAIVGADYIARGVTKLADWSTEMVKEFGDRIKPYLQDIYDRATESAKALDRGALVDKMKDKFSGDQDLGALRNHINTLALDLINEGEVGTRDELVDAVHAELQNIVPDITREQTADAIAGYGDFKPLDTDEAKVQLRAWKGELQQLGKLRDMQDGQAPAKSGVERRTPSDEERQLIKKVEAAKKKGGFNITDPARQLKSALDAIKTRLRNQITDLDQQIQTRQKIVPEKNTVPLDAEAKDLQAQRDELKKQYDSIFAKPEMTDEERMQAASRAADRQIAAIEKQLRDNELFPKGKAQRLTSPELEAKRARIDALKAEREYARHVLQPKPDPDTQAEKEAASLDRQITAIEKQLKDEAPFTKGKSVQEQSPENAARRARLKELQGTRRNLRDRLQPKPDPLNKEQRALQAYKTRLANRMADLQEQLAAGVIQKPNRTPTVLDRDAQLAKNAYERAKKRADKLQLQVESRNRTVTEKIRNTFAKWVRIGALSWPTVFAKLTGAAIMRYISTPLEQAVGYGASKVLPGIAARAPLEGVPDFRGAIQAEAKANTEGWTTGMQGAWDMIHNRETDLQVQMEKAHLDPALLDYLGKLHGAFKYPTLIADYARRQELLTQHAIRSGLDPKDPLVQVRLSQEAWQAAKRSIFMQDNVLNAGYKALIGRLEATDKTLGRPSTVGKFLSSVAQTELPIVKVPTNVIAEASQAVGGLLTGSAQAVWAHYKGLENLKPAEHDAIMRNIKKGLIGNALLLLGFFKHQSAGGLYVPGKPGGSNPALKPGQIKVGDTTIPAGLLHGPYSEVFQMGATVGNLVGTRKSKNQPDPMGFGAASMAAAVGMLDAVPFIRETTTIGKYMDVRQQGNAFASKAASIAVPGAVQWLAQQTDKPDPFSLTSSANRRDPKGLLQNIQADIPGLRQHVPLKKVPPPPGSARKSRR